MSKNNQKQSYNVNMKLSTTTIFLIIFGVGCIIIANIFSNALTKEFLSKYYATKPILDIVNAFGGALLSAGVVSILVEISTIKELTFSVTQ